MVARQRARGNSRFAVSATQQSTHTWGRGEEEIKTYTGPQSSIVLSQRRGLRSNGEKLPSTSKGDSRSTPHMTQRLYCRCRRMHKSTPKLLPSRCHQDRAVFFAESASAARWRSMSKETRGMMRRMTQRFSFSPLPMRTSMTKLLLSSCYHDWAFFLAKSAPWLASNLYEIAKHIESGSPPESAHDAVIPSLLR